MGEDKVIQMRALTPSESLSKEEVSTKRLSYEQLETVASQLSGQCQELSNRLKQAQMHINHLAQDSYIKRIELLFNVLNKSEYFNPDFVANVVKELEEVLTQQEPEETNETPDLVKGEE